MYVAQVRKHAFGQNDVNLFLLCRKYNLENDYNAVRDTPSLWKIHESKNPVPDHWHRLKESKCMNLDTI